MRGPAGRERCSCTPGRARSGRAWAGSCWPMSRRSPRRWPSWSRMFVAQTGFSLQQVLAGGEPVTGIDHIQPVLVGVQLALTALWRSYGVEPDAVIGHSMGEVTAAVVAGALTAAEGLQVIATRSRLMARLSGQGAMALLELDAGDTEALIAEHPQVTVAVYASPRQTVIAGPPEQIDQLIAVVAGQDRLARRVDVDVASHHPIIDPMLPELRAMLAGLAPKSPEHPDHHHRRQCRSDTGIRRRALGGQPAQPRSLQPGHRHRRPTPRHLHRDQPPPAAHPRHHRHPGRHPSPQHRNPAARHRRHPHLPHQPQRHPHHPPPRTAAPARTPPAHPHHPLAPHPPLDRRPRAPPDADARWYGLPGIGRFRSFGASAAGCACAAAGGARAPRVAGRSRHRRHCRGSRPPDPRCAGLSRGCLL